MLFSPSRRALDAVSAALLLIGCSEESTLRIVDRPGLLDPTDAGASGETGSEGGAKIVEPPGASEAALYLSFDRMPPEARDGQLVTVDGSDAASTAGAVGMGIEPNASTLLFPGEGADIGAESFTILIWIRPSPSATPGAEQPILDKRTNPSSGVYRGYFLGLQSSKVVFQMASLGVSKEVHYSAGEIPADCDWHLVVATAERKLTLGGRLYVDGKVVRTFVDTDATLANAAALRIGSNHFGNTRFVGSLDELMISKTVLTEQDIAAYYRDVRARLPASPAPCE